MSPLVSMETEKLCVSSTLGICIDREVFKSFMTVCMSLFARTYNLSYEIIIRAANFQQAMGTSCPSRCPLQVHTNSKVIMED
jgi:hypothetical protein